MLIPYCPSMRFVVALLFMCILAPYALCDGECVDAEEYARVVRNQGVYQYYADRLERKVETLHKSIEKFMKKNEGVFDATGHNVDAQNAIDPNTYATVQQVDRRHDLSFEEFYNEYNLKKKPVVITDYAEKMTPKKFTLEHIKNVCGSKSVFAQFRVQGAETWGGLLGGVETTVAEFIDKLEHGQEGYIHDWSLPEYCMEIMQDFVMPKYFAQDFVHRVRSEVDGITYRKGWPSLFIGPKNSSSALHIDTMETSFWMLLVEGRKLWRFFDPEDIPFLYEKKSTGSFRVDPLNPNLEKFPLYAYARPYDVTLGPGELLFVPNGCPHVVHNLDNTVAVAGNFIDAANFDMVVEDAGAHTIAGIEGTAKNLYHEFMNPNFPKNMDMQQKDLPYNEFFYQPIEGHPYYTEARS